MITNTSNRNTALACLAASLALCAVSAGAQSPGSRSAREFAQAAASADEFEILEAQTVLAQTTNQEVRAFATRMLQDHQQFGQAVQVAAARAGLKPPEMALSADQAQMLGALQSAGAGAFDKLYLQQQVLAHRAALVVEQNYAKSGDDAGLRRLAASTVPLISTHDDMAKQMEEKAP